jgi:ClpP class serine protease
VSIFDFLWIFFILAALQPVVRQRMLDAARLRVLRKIEQNRSSRVIALIHRQETLSLLGFPLARYIDVQDSEEVLRAIKLTDPQVPIDLVLHTPGGLVLAAEQIAMALCRHKARVTVFVPHYALSGGTLIALAADEIVMDDNAVLGPVDPQVGQWPAVSILSVIDQKDKNEIDDQTLVLADVARKAMRQVKASVVEILTSNGMEEKAADIAEILTSGTWTHDYPISASELKSFGLAVSTKLPTEIYQLMSLFPQAGPRRPSVQYIPLPYTPPSRDPGERRSGDRN